MFIYSINKKNENASNIKYIYFISAKIKVHIFLSLSNNQSKKKIIKKNRRKKVNVYLSA